MGFNSAFKGLKIVKNPGNGRLNNLNDPVLIVLTIIKRLVTYFSFSLLHRTFWLTESFIAPTNAQQYTSKHYNFTLKYKTIAPTCFGFD